MSSSTFILDSLDDTFGLSDNDPIVSFSDGTDQIAGDSAPWSEAGYDGSPAIDYRIRQLSYSSLLTLHSCPRKFQLYKLRAAKTADSKDASLTFSFGHLVGHAIQASLSGVPTSKIIWELFLQWPHALDDIHSKYRKSLWEAIMALQRFESLKESVLGEYEVVLVNGKPAVELSFCINLPDGFRYRGHVDLVLRNIHTGEVLVLELKTTGMRSVSPAQYKNSAQALGYSIILDQLFPGLSSYHVLYLVYQSESREYTPFPFTKTYLQRALWLREMLLDIEFIKSCEAAEVYPMRGESCFSFMRECEYLNTCTLSTSLLTKPCTPEAEDKTDYTVNVSFLDLLETQLANVAIETGDPA